MGNHKGEHVFYVGNKSFAEHIQEGAILAIPDPAQGIIYKRPERCTELEKMAAFTLEEAATFTEQWNKKVEEQNHD